MTTLNELVPQQFNQLLFEIKPPAGIIPPYPASQADRVYSPLTWAESPSGIGLNRVQAALDAIIKSLPFAQRRPVDVPFPVPYLPSHYVDRPEARKLLRDLLLGEEAITPGTLVVSAIYGLGGIGKSVLASALAHDLKVQEKFPDGVLWVTLGQKPEILKELGNWIQELRDSDYKPITIEATCCHLSSLLYKKRMLLVVDDAWSGEAVEPFRVGGSGCRVLVTTREAWIPGAQRVDLEQMKPDEALVLVERCLRPRKLNEKDRHLVLEFAEMVGYLPLALELAAAQVQDGQSWRELQEDFRGEVARLEGLDAPDLMEAMGEKAKKQRSLKASFNLSLQRLNPEYLERFTWMGVLPEDVSIGTAAMATIWDVPLPEAKGTLRELRRRSLLLDGIGRKGQPTYKMHDLMHDTACSRLQNSPGLAEAHQQVCVRYRNRAGLWWNLPDDGYIHSHLTEHLERAGLTEEIHELLRTSNEQGRNAWFEACDRLGVPAIFVQDIARGWRLAEALQAKDAGRSLVLQVRYGLMVATLNSLASNIPPELMAELVKHGHWSIEQAWAYLEQIKEEHRQAKAIELLVCHLSPFLREKAISLAQRMKDKGSANRVMKSLESQQVSNLMSESKLSTKAATTVSNKKISEIQQALADI